MWYLGVDRASVGPELSGMRTKYAGPVTIAQDLTTFTITKDAVVARPMVIDLFAWPMAGPTTMTSLPVDAPSPPPVWWADARVTD